MIQITGVRFRKSSKVYYFDPSGYDIKKGDHVIVETARGIEYGKVVLAAREVPDDKVVSPLKPLLRLATAQDDQKAAENEKKEKDAYAICQEKIKKHGLKMKLIDSEYTFDRNKLLFYFTADGRIDFRELVKDLASVFRTRIELRQIGVRDETKLLGGIGICGRPLCCHTFLSDFAPVSIKMAKEQGLSLNPSQISGMCGRLMCCLKNEQEAYEELNRTLPAIGSQVKTIDGYTGEVQNTSVLKQMVKIVITKKNGEREIREYPVADLSFRNHRITGQNAQDTSLEEIINAAELEQLEILEQQDQEDRLEEPEQPTGRRDNRRSRNSHSNRRTSAESDAKTSHSGYDHTEHANVSRPGGNAHSRSERPAGKRGSSDHAPDNRSGYERPTGRRGSSDHTPDNRGGYERPTGKRGSSDHTPDNRGGYERPTGRRSSSDHTPDNRGGYERPTGRRGSSDHTPDNRGGYERPTGKRGSSDHTPNAHGGYERLMDTRREKGRPERPREEHEQSGSDREYTSGKRSGAGRRRQERKNRNSHH